MESTETSTAIPAPDTDRAISLPAEDEYGFCEIAKKLAPSLIAATKTDGMVVGIEGKWGSGKTSLLNFLTAELETQKNERLRVINLPPWLHGDANMLVDALFRQMIPSLEEEEQQTQPEKKWHPFNRRKASQIGQIMGRYAAKAGRGLSPLLKLAGVLYPSAVQAGEFLDRGSKYLDKALQETSVSDLKQQIADRLEKSRLKFVVLLDDLDRLEPKQTSEVIRLVRSVADFPHVVYCLCYDRETLKHALEHDLNVKDGHAYLQKIVQQTFAMPLPEPFDLRHSLLEKLRKLYKEVNDKPLSEEEDSDLRSAVDREGNRLEVLRDVPLVLNAVKFSYPQLKRDVYFPDICWIQIVRAKHPNLYFWIESYLATHSVLTTTRASVGKSSYTKFGKELQNLLPDKDDVSSQDSIWNLTSYIPGVEAKEDAESCVFQKSTDRKISDFIVKKRIGSPFHSRLYFAFAIPKTLMPENRWNELVRLTIEDVSQLTTQLTKLAGEKRPVGGSWFSHVVDRLDVTTLESMSTENLAGWAAAICGSMDDVLKVDNEIAAFSVSTAHKTTYMMQRLIKELRKKDSAAAEEIIDKIFRESTSINWLVGDWFRQELFDHGLVGDHARSDDCALERTEIDKVREILKTRLKDKSLLSAIGDFPDLARFMYGWRDLAGIRSPRSWVKQYVTNEFRFLNFLLAMRGWTASDRVYYPLRKAAVEEFLDWDAMLKRVKKLAKSDEAEVSKLAAEVLEAIELAREN